MVIDESLFQKLFLGNNRSNLNRLLLHTFKYGFGLRIKINELSVSTLLSEIIWANAVIGFKFRK